jgi:hypothetical protein
VQPTKVTVQVVVLVFEVGGGINQPAAVAGFVNDCCTYGELTRHGPRPHGSAVDATAACLWNACLQAAHWDAAEEHGIWKRR